MQVRILIPYKHFICNFTGTYEDRISYENCFNSICGMKMSKVKLMFRTPRFHMWNFEPVKFPRELGISYVNRFPFRVWNESFVCEDAPVLYVFHRCKGYHVPSYPITSENLTCQRLRLTWYNCRRSQWEDRVETWLPKKSSTQLRWNKIIHRGKKTWLGKYDLKNYKIKQPGNDEKPKP